MFTKDVIYEHLYNDAEGSLQLSFEEAIAIQKILVDNGYSVLMSGGDLKDRYRIDWIYAGTVGDTKFADANEIIFSSREWLEMLEFGDYEEDEDE